MLRRLICGLLPLAAACGPETPIERDIATLQDYMQAHFSDAADIRDAVINGDFINMYRAAARLAEEREIGELPAGWTDHLRRMRAAAARVSATNGAREAAEAAAQLARTCGECHAATDARPELPEYAPPVWGEHRSRYMLRHAWAAARMWEGLIGPSDTHWVQGAAILSEQPLRLGEYLDGTVLPAGLRALDESMSALAVRAGRAKDPGERTRLYADFIGRCARCHEAVKTLTAVD